MVVCPLTCSGTAFQFCMLHGAKLSPAQNPAGLGPVLMSGATVESIAQALVGTKSQENVQLPDA